MRLATLLIIILIDNVPIKFEKLIKIFSISIELIYLKPKYT